MNKFTERLHFEIAGTPKAKKRHRSTTQKGLKFSRNYNPSAKEEELFLKEVMRELGYINKIKGPIYVESIFCFKRPKSHFGTGKNSELLKKSAPKYHITKPDIDNLEKFLFDSLTGYLWKDDSQIIQSESYKYYSNDKTEYTMVKVYYQKQEE